MYGDKDYGLSEVELSGRQRWRKCEKLTNVNVY